MKKLFVLLIMLFLVGLFTGCKDPYLVDEEALPSYEEIMNQMDNTTFFSWSPEKRKFFRKEREWIINNINPFFRRYPQTDEQQLDFVYHLIQSMGKKKFDKDIKRIYKNYPNEKKLKNEKAYKLFGSGNNDTKIKAFIIQKKFLWRYFRLLKILNTQNESN